MLTDPQGKRACLTTWQGRESSEALDTRHDRRTMLGDAVRLCGTLRPELRVYSASMGRHGRADKTRSTVLRHLALPGQRPLGDGQPGSTARSLPTPEARERGTDEVRSLRLPMTRQCARSYEGHV